MSFNEPYLNSAQQSCLEWSVMRSCKEGEKNCGDAYLVSENGNHQILIAVIDGLGHGKLAAEASSKAVELMTNARHQSLINLVKYCHKGLRRSRGVVMGLALINFWEHTLAWLGVGNIKGVLFLADEKNQVHNERMIERSGIVGYNLPFLQVSMVPIVKGDVLLFSTDGVQNSYLDKVDRSNTPEEIVRISSSSFKGSDDALIFAAKYKGNRSL